MSKKQEVIAIIRDKRKRILSVGKNSYEKSHPWMAMLAAKFNVPFKIYLHAEVDAILKCPDLSRAHSIEVIRFDKNGQPANAKPCEICQEAIRMSGIKKVTHT